MPAKAKWTSRITRIASQAVMSFLGLIIVTATYWFAMSEAEANGPRALAVAQGCFITLAILDCLGLSEGMGEIVRHLFARSRDNRRHADEERRHAKPVASDDGSRENPTGLGLFESSPPLANDALFKLVGVGKNSKKDLAERVDEVLYGRRRAAWRTR